MVVAPVVFSLTLRVFTGLLLYCLSTSNPPHRKKTSSKSHDYSRASERSSGNKSLAQRGRPGCVRLVFLCRVVQGRSWPDRNGFMTQQAVDENVIGQNQSAADPSGGGGGCYDSVEGLTRSEGGALSWDELVVYKDEAAIPSYLIVYAPGQRR